MHVDRYERYWMWAATGMLVLFTSAIVITAVTGAAHPPSHTEVVDPETLTIAGEFATPGATTHPDGSVTVSLRAEFYVFRPEQVRVPAGVPVTFRVTSPDVLHGFQIVGTNVNLTVAPGYVSQATVTFETPGEYLVVCNEYCGLGHHLMQGKVIVEAAK
ncbi:MAG: cytochrome c oxidase subunit II [Acidobacteria bacterium]|nr:cytochrome c oxidase subunit II [Acidobacteriota bacterium]